jgi:cytidylate kinase
MNAPTHIVAIDGPAGAGKSTAARRVAEELGIAFLDTGAMYRAATWRALHEEVDLEDPGAIAASTRAMDLRLEASSGGLRIYVDGKDVTQAIRTPEVTRCIFHIDQNPEVRQQLVELQRAFAQRGPTVAEGRDMGTVVFPKARCKIFLDASLDERARRRTRELEEKGAPPEFDEVRREMAERDEKTRNRAVAPLRRAPDALHLDTTGMLLDEVVARIAAEARASL